MINYLNRKAAVSSKQIRLATLKNDLQRFAWKIADIGVDNNNDGLIELSLLDYSCRNLILQFERNKSGSIVQTNKAGRKFFYLFDWEIDYRQSLLIISSEHSLFALKPKWKFRPMANGLLLFYDIKLSCENVKIALSLEKVQKTKKASFFFNPQN